MQGRGMIIVGITGGIGTGKGLATEFFRSRGAAIIDADEIARELAQPGSQMVAGIALEFGQCALRPDGSLDRRKLAGMVFGDPDAVARLNAVTHPPIKAEVERRIQSLARAGTTGVACLVAPLLLEAGLGDTVDRLLVMTADEETRVQRVMARDSVSEDQVRARMAAQMPASEQVERADWVVDATGEREEALRELDTIWAELNE
ncbi:MAG: dephospho-CoA kinase [Armatimonadetes bacterium]|nr:dephospho-CoA kinase [Armatimonadota bacterium]